jgi:hypothetical protein
METNTTTLGGMLDRSRMTLCVFMFAILAFNPFTSLLSGFGSQLGGGDGGAHGTSRTLQSIETEADVASGWFAWMLPTVIMWLLNGTIVAAVLARIFVFGEPITKPLSESSVRYWRHRKQADMDLAKGEYAAAATQLRSCLHALGRPLPTSKLDLAASLGWQSVRQALHRIYVGRWLSRHAGAFYSSVKADDVKSSARDAALVYHKLHQLYLTGHISAGSMSGVNLALCAVNLAEAAGNAVSRGMRQKFMQRLA